MKAQDLKNSILQMAVQGDLVDQDPSDEPASVLLERIRGERAELIKQKKIKPPKGGESVIYREGGSWYERRGNADPVCIDDEIPFDIPGSWEWARLGSIATFTGGGTPDKSNRKYWNGEIPWVSMKDVHGSILKSTVDRITREGLLSKPSITVCKPGQLIISTRLIPGKTIVAGIECAINQDLKAMQTSLPIGFPVVWFESQLDVFKRLGTGTTVPGIKLEHLNEALFPIPPLAEQQRIVERVEQLTSLIEGGSE